MKLLYIKHGNAAAQARAYRAASPRLPDGGPNAYVLDLLSELRGWQVYLLSSGVEADFYSQAGLRARSIALRSGGCGTKLLVHARFALVCLWTLVSYRPNVVLCAQKEVPLWLCWLWGRLAGVPFVYSAHSCVMHNPPKTLKHKIFDKLNLKALRSASSLLCLGPYLRDELHGCFKSSVSIREFLPGVYDLKAASQRLPRVSSAVGPAKGCGILYVGRIEIGKGVFDLLNAFREIALERSSATLMFVGAGREQERLGRTVAAYGLEDRVCVAGPCTYDALGRYYSSARVVVVATRQWLGEGLCKTVLEAQAFGVPVVGPDYGAFRYTIHAGVNGLRYKPDSVNDLTNVLRRVLSDEALYSRLRASAGPSIPGVGSRERRFGRLCRRALESATEKQ